MLPQVQQPSRLRLVGAPRRKRRPQPRSAAELLEAQQRKAKRLQAKLLRDALLAESKQQALVEEHDRLREKETRQREQRDRRCLQKASRRRSARDRRRTAARAWDDVLAAEKERQGSKPAVQERRQLRVKSSKSPARPGRRPQPWCTAKQSPRVPAWWTRDNIQRMGARVYFLALRARLALAANGASACLLHSSVVDIAASVRESTGSCPLGRPRFSAVGRRTTLWMQRFKFTYGRCRQGARQ